MKQQPEQLANGEHKAVIETMINTCALALTSFSVVTLTTQHDDFFKALILLFIGMGLEFFKYKGRQKKLW